MAWRVKTGRARLGACAIAAVPPASHSTTRVDESLGVTADPPRPHYQPAEL
jgi:hypothetical protein